MHMVVNTSPLHVYKKYRITSFLCIFETIIKNKKTTKKTTTTKQQTTTNKHNKKNVRVGPPLTKLSGSAHAARLKPYTASPAFVYQLKIKAQTTNQPTVHNIHTTSKTHLKLINRLSLSQRDDFKVSKGTKIGNRYNQVPHLTQDTNGKVTNSQLDTTNESQEVSPFPAGDHKAHRNRRAQRHS